MFTSKREVTAMLDLVKLETERIESRFLEPACGTGNFLIEILNRKLIVIRDRYLNIQLEYERNAVLAISSLYGIEILEDNVLQCRQRLFDFFDSEYRSLFDITKEECRASVKHLLSRNIIWGNALTLETVGEPPEPIVFSEWSRVSGSFFKRRDYSFRHLLQLEKTDEPPLSSDLGEYVFIPTPIRDYPLIHFLRLADVN